jgi:Na+-transporting methylmalonyl-CoA/oxaloacetate decarboxylase gamma subunit
MRAVIDTVSRNRSLVRLLAAYLVNVLVEYGEWITLLVYAYRRGGASEAGLVAVAQLLPSIVLGPVLTAHGSRFGIVRLLLISFAVEAVSLGCCGVAILEGAPAALVYASAIVFVLGVSVSRPLHQVLMPLVVKRPDELAAANVATSWSEGLGAVAGPALAGAMISIEGPGLACAVLALLACAMPVLGWVRPRRVGASVEEGGGGFADLAAAARAILSRPTTRALIAYPAGSAAIEGAMDLLVVILAVKILTLGAGAAGYLSAAFGAGGVVGGAAAVLLVGRRLAWPLAAAALLGSAALGLLALASTVIVAVALIVTVAAARSVQSVAAQTLLQRSTPLDVIVCAFSLVEGIRDMGLAFGALAVPLFVRLGGSDAAFIGMASFGPLVVAATWRRLRRLDDEATIPVVEMGLLRNLEIFRALPAAPLETLAREARYETVRAGTQVILQGDVGDTYYAIVEGGVVVTCDGTELTRLGSGEGFGEIALLHASPRTSTVTASIETTLVGINSDAFLVALNASSSVHAAVSKVAAERRARDRPTA